MLERARPVGIILFPRNINTPNQTRELVAALEDLEPRPFVAADLEGGVVNRLTALWGDLPSPAQAAACGRRAVRGQRIGLEGDELAGLGQHVVTADDRA